MALTLRICVRKLVYLLAGVVLLGFAASVHADPKPLSKAEQAKVDNAIEEGVAYLKRKQTKEGDFAKTMAYWSDQYLVGQTLLPAYALLEAGMPAKDPVIQKAADYIRPKILNSEQTYEISLGLLFFDCLGNPKDKKLIHTLALRLVTGQHRTGGWNYRCPTLREDDEALLIRLLEDLGKIEKSGEPLNAKSINRLHVPSRLKPLTVFQDPKTNRWGEPHGSDFSSHVQLFGGTTDNSNTQFAMLGLWVARRHGIPVEPCFRRMVERFEKTQRQDGWWPYDLRFDRRAAYSPSSMICVGLMGLAIGRGVIPAPPKTTLPKTEDSRVLNGLAALYREIGYPTGQMDRPIPLQMRGCAMYFLWSVERVAMLYNLPSLGDKDWYRWGVELLVVNQKAAGNWESPYGPVVGTSFALLFLKRSHPMKDLTPKLPFTAKELNQGIARLRSEDKYPVQPAAPSSKSRNPVKAATPPN